MISHVYKTIYIHQRKCAGMSIISSFGITPEMPDWHIYNNGVCDREWGERSERERDYFIFSSVRNPFDRVVSAWKYLESTRERPLEEVLAAPPQGGADYRHFTRPQADILCNPATRRVIVDDLVRFETLQSDWDRISKRIRKPLCRLEHVNAGTREPGWRQYFTPHARKLAEALFWEDLTLFEYAY